ncbi:MAG: sugar phosphate isomerase/epimerase [Planctomycetota bacterium]|nr:sugar phosphate isomerase/epimerase [Planctomycetota bacterium]
MPRKKIPIAVQVYSVRKEAEADLPGVLKQIGKMGYEGVEFAGYYGHSAKDLRKMLDDNGLKCAGTHIKLDTLLGDELPKTVEFNKVIGNKFLIVPGLQEQYRGSKDAWKKTAGIFNEIAERLKPHKMFTGYHNHTVEFQPLDGELPWDTFFGNTKKDVVMQVDTGNALHGGANVVPFVSKYPGRALTVHLKEYAAGRDKALIGEGDVDWTSCFDLCESVGATEWYIIEQESYAFPPMECIDKCLQNVKKLLA